MAIPLYLTFKHTKLFQENLNCRPNLRGGGCEQSARTVYYKSCIQPHQEDYRCCESVETPEIFYPQYFSQFSFFT